MCDEKVLREVFSAFDIDKSGAIDGKELKAVLTAYFQSVSQPADEKRINDTAAVSASGSSGSGLKPGLVFWFTAK